MKYHVLLVSIYYGGLYFGYALKNNYVVIKKQKPAVSKQQETLPVALSFPVLQAVSLENKLIFRLCFIQCPEFGFGHYIPVHT